jgi:hypothetical protein
MLIFEAIEALKTSRLSIKNDIPLTSPQQDPKVRRLVQAAMVTCTDLETYQLMTASQGRNLARLTLDLLDQNDKIFLSIAVVVFNKLACIVPGALDGLYERLMTFHFGTAYGSIFRQADALTRNELLVVIEHAQTNGTINEWQQWVSALAWIGDEVAQRQLYRWLLESSPHVGQPRYCLRYSMRPDGSLLVLAHAEICISPPALRLFLMKILRKSILHLWKSLFPKRIVVVVVVVICILSSI